MDTRRYFEVGDREDLSYEDKLAEYRKLADEYFEVERYTEFCSTALAHVDELMLDWVVLGGVRRAADRDRPRDLPGARAGAVRRALPRPARAVGDRARAHRPDASTDRRSKAVVTAGSRFRGARRAIASPRMNAALHTEADAVARLAAARPMVVDVVPASEVSAHHAAGGVTHAGPPIEPARMCPPMRAALGSALWLEGVAGSPAEALLLVDDGQIPLATNHDAGGVGPMAGVVNPSMPVWVARDEATGKVAWCPLNEGSGAVLRYGADGPGGDGAAALDARRAGAGTAGRAQAPARPARA